MLIDYTSDLHVDFYLKYNDYDIEDFKNSKLHSFFKQKRGDILIIAGDLGHYNEQNIFVLKTLRDYYGYKKIFFVLGNHDYYLLQSSMVTRYNNSSFKKIHEMRKMCQDLKDIYVLNGDIVEHKGVCFGGTGLWYDGKYAQKLDPSINREKIDKLWHEKVLDAQMIYGIKSYDALFFREIEKLKKINGKSDIIITHINPSANHLHTPPKHSLDKINGFFCFDGEQYLQNTNAKYWIFGHIHDSIEYQAFNTKALCNPLGYPGENPNAVLKTFEF